MGTPTWGAMTLTQLSLPGCWPSTAPLVLPIKSGVLINTGSPSGDTHMLLTVSDQPAA